MKIIDETKKRSGSDSVATRNRRKSTSLQDQPRKKRGESGGPMGIKKKGSEKTNCTSLARHTIKKGGKGDKVRGEEFNLKKGDRYNG